MNKRVLIVGNPRETHVGRHFLQGAGAAGVIPRLLDLDEAFQAPRLLRSLWWRCFGHRPVHLGRFSHKVVRSVQAEQPDLLLATGIAPLSAAALIELRRQQVTTCCFLTDDPWNPQHRAPWFMTALRHYAHVFTPRRANIEDLEALRGPAVHYLPFGYSPEVHHPPEVMTAAEAVRWQSEVLFVGGADQERADLMRFLAGAGFNLSLWGGYWDQMEGLRTFARGHAGSAEFQKLVAQASVNVCLVRRANRDGHSMRSFEIPAIGGCMVVEDTAEHREIFGPDDTCVRYFSSPASLVEKIRELLAEPARRMALAKAASQRIHAGRNTYSDRLIEMLEVAAR